jgi:4-methylaminobutanoate oxidase (formaldehyde-forming)
MRLLNLDSLSVSASLVQEKAFRDYGHDIDGTDNILEAGLSFTCDFKKDGDFIGQDKVEEQKTQRKQQGGLTRKMAQVLVKDSEPLMGHGEVVWRNGEPISDIRAASFGHTLGGAVGLTMLDSSSQGGFVNKDFIKSGEWKVEIADRMYPCELSLAPMYDPKNLRVKV